VSVPALLPAVVEALDRAGIPHMLTGSMAAAWYGAGRATLDIDIVIAASAEPVEAFVAGIATPDIYVSAEAAREALAGQTMFNVVEISTGWKVDLIIRKSRAFSLAEFERRQPIDFAGIQLWVASVEDLIVAKLEWAKLGGSTRQLEDVATLVRVAGSSIDHAYLDRWILALTLQPQWSASQARGDS